MERRSKSELRVSFNSEGKKSIAFTELAEGRFRSHTLDHAEQRPPQHASSVLQNGGAETSNDALIIPLTERNKSLPPETISDLAKQEFEN